MDKTFVLKSRLNSTFAILALFSVVSALVSIVAVILYFIAQLLISAFNLGEVWYNKSYYYLIFVVPQILLPVVTALVGCLIPVIGKFKFSDCVKSEKVPLRYFFLCLMIFPGLSTVMTNISYAITDLFILMGVPIKDINASIPVPDGAFEVVMLFFVMAVLPALCEELIYRGFVLRGLSEYGTTGALVVSSIAFGLMHATVQQIPFAFSIGLFLGYVSLRFKSLVLPIILHFINNFIACVVMVMQIYLDYELVYDIVFCFDLFCVVVAVLGLAIFVILTVYDKKNSEVDFHDRVFVGVSENEILDEEAEIVEEKPDFRYAVTHSWGFWLFTIVFLFSTVVNILLAATSA